MRIARHMLRPLLLVAAVGLLGAVPVALAVTADPFGAPEIADSKWHPGTNYLSEGDFFGADGAGNVLLGTIFRDTNGGRSGRGLRALRDRSRHVAAHRGEQRRRRCRCRWACEWRATGRRWRSGGSPAGGTIRHFSAVRPPGGAWGAAGADRRRPGGQLRAVRPQRHGRRRRVVGGHAPGGYLGVDPSRRRDVGGAGEDRRHGS